MLFSHYRKSQTYIVAVNLGSVTFYRNLTYPLGISTMTQTIYCTDFISDGRLYVNYRTAEDKVAPIVFTIHKKALSADVSTIKNADPDAFHERMKEIGQVARQMCIKHEKQYADLEYGLDHTRVEASEQKHTVTMTSVLTTTLVTGLVIAAIGIGIGLAKR